MSFQDIIDQEAAVRILQDELERERISHAYLFVGKDGTGKKTLALEFARALNCLNMQTDSCGECLACQKINHSNHPDVRVIGIEDGSTIKIEQIRELQHDLAYKPYESAFKVFIIDQVERMTPQAANSLLKTLEEPPEYAVIILLAEELQKLLPTVVSRCQQVYLHSVNQDVIKKQLLEIGIEEEHARLISRLADGSLGRALELAGDDEFLTIRRDLIEFLADLPEADTVEIFRQVDNLIKLQEREGFPLFDLILSWYRDIIIYNQGSQDNLINLDCLERIKSQQSIYNIDELIAIVELINQFKTYINLNVRTDLALQVLLFKIRAKRV